MDVSKLEVMVCGAYLLSRCAMSHGILLEYDFPSDQSTQKAPYRLGTRMSPKRPSRIFLPSYDIAFPSFHNSKPS